MEQLPVELADLVVTHLSLPDYQVIRLVSRRLHALTLSTFINRYFTRRTTTLSPPSLGRLSQVSSRKHLASSVTLLDIKLLNHEDYKNLRKISRVGKYPPPKRFQQVAQVRSHDISEESAFFENMRTVDYGKSVVKALAEALRGFPHLLTVRFRVNGGVVDLNYTFNDLHLEDRDNYALFVKDCFAATIDAIVDSGLKLKELSLVKGSRLRTFTKSANLIYPAFNFSVPKLLALNKSFSSLKILRLSISCDYHENARIPGWQNGISQFVATATLLEELTLYFQPCESEPAYRAAVMQSLLTTLDLPLLRALHLFGCVVDQQVLSKFFEAHKTLRRMSLSDTYLLNGPWSAVLVSLRDILDLEKLLLCNLLQNGHWWEIDLNGQKRKKIRMSIKDGTEQKSMRQMLTEVIDFLTSESTFPEGHVPVA